jgi:3,4-dihydroxy-9,10-secoandrosta-1,3,5(10)-triene-9,17-dione 4,5-dioxygenase
VKLTGMGYIGFAAPDPAGWLAYATDVLGMMPARALPGEDFGNPKVPGSGPASRGSGVAPDGTVYLKVDDHQWRIAIHAGEAPGIRYMGFQVADGDALDAAVAEVAATGATVTRGTAEEAFARGVRGLAWCTDPSGYRIELFHTPVIDLNFVSPRGTTFVTGDLGLGHVLLFVADMDANLAFYRNVLGFKRSDFFSAGPGMSLHFLRCTPRHHSIGLIHVGPFNGVHHLMLEVPSIDEVGAILDRANDAGLPITSSLGRHVNDRMVSFYMRSPGGFDVEVGYDGVIVDENWCDHEATGGDPWGHRGMTVKALEDFGEKRAEA